MTTPLSDPLLYGRLSAAFHHTSRGVIQSAPAAILTTLGGMGSVLALKTTNLDPFLVSLWAGVVSSSLLTGLVVTSGAGLIEPRTKKFAPLLSTPARQGFRNLGKTVAIGLPFLVAVGATINDVSYLKQDQMWQMHPAVQRIEQLIAG